MAGNDRHCHCQLVEISFDLGICECETNDWLLSNLCHCILPNRLWSLRFLVIKWWNNSRRTQRNWIVNFAPLHLKSQAQFRVETPACIGQVQNKFVETTYSASCGANKWEYSSWFRHKCEYIDRRNVFSRSRSTDILQNEFIEITWWCRPTISQRQNYEMVNVCCRSCGRPPFLTLQRIVINRHIYAGKGHLIVLLFPHQK